MTIHTIESNFDRLPEISHVIQQLRSEMTAGDIENQIKRQFQSGYQLAWGEEDGEVVCVAGYWIQEKLAWKKHIYVDELVTFSKHRSLGYGAQMLHWLRTRAEEKGCVQFHLDSGVQRFEAHAFYLRNGFQIRSHHFAQKFTQS